ncbi:MAG: hypothetical protein J3K34DRAFT_469154 [Monoraphidium minutum]|nr:MAG: hypothetical protein J3K34DRAFT_469154 [Monoraphidium minutum]
MQICGRPRAPAARRAAAAALLALALLAACAAAPAAAQDPAAAPADAAAPSEGEGTIVEVEAVARPRGGAPTKKEDLSCCPLIRCSAGFKCGGTSNGCGCKPDPSQGVPPPISGGGGSGGPKPRRPFKPRCSRVRVAGGRFVERCEPILY